jgi:hypothetical protein
MGALAMVNLQSGNENGIETLRNILQACNNTDENLSGHSQIPFMFTHGGLWSRMCCSLQMLPASVGFREWSVNDYLISYIRHII